jgi:hypothetical protein
MHDFRCYPADYCGNDQVNDDVHFFSYVNV